MSRRTFENVGLHVECEDYLGISAFSGCNIIIIKIFFSITGVEKSIGTVNGKKVISY